MFKKLVSKLSEKPFMIREGSSLHSILIAVRRYGRRFRRQITSVTALRRTVCRWTVVRWSADAADFEDEPKKTPIGWSADERRILGFLLLSSSTFHFTLLNASVACGQNISLIFALQKVSSDPFKVFFVPKKEAKICEKKQELIFLPLLYTIDIFCFNQYWAKNKRAKDSEKYTHWQNDDTYWQNGR